MNQQCTTVAMRAKLIPIYTSHQLMELITPKGSIERPSPTVRDVGKLEGVQLRAIQSTQVSAANDAGGKTEKPGEEMVKDASHCTFNTKLVTEETV